jgi:hypothetical protein
VVTADEVYGGDPALRRWLEGRGVWHVLAVKCPQPLVVAASKGLMATTAEQVAAAVPAERWVTPAPGTVPRPRRLYDWTRVELAAPAAPGMARWLLVRRGCGDPQLAF